VGTATKSTPVILGLLAFVTFVLLLDDLAFDADAASAAEAGRSAGRIALPSPDEMTHCVAGQISSRSPTVGAPSQTTGRSTTTCVRYSEAYA
jgi:hypothetical protein